MEPADLTQPIVLDGAYMVFRIETAEDIEAAERQLAALKANILADRTGCVMVEGRGIEPLRPSLTGYGLASRPIATLATFLWRIV